MGLAALVVFVGDDAQIGDVLCDDRTLLGLGQRKEVRIRERAQFGALSDRIDVMSASTELLGDRGRYISSSTSFTAQASACSCALPRGELPFATPRGCR